MFGSVLWRMAVVTFCLLVFCTVISPTSSAGDQNEAFVSAKRSWGPEQATGQPDTPEAGDFETAWASLSPDDIEEWLICEYPEPVAAKAISVYESYNPGALYKVTAFNAEGEEVLAWEGEDPTPRDKPKGISVIPVKLDFPVRKLKLYIDSPAVPGWNEIDAVSLEDENGNKQWATRVVASTTYADPISAVADGKRNWGPEQATGEPDTPEAGDYVTAWASATSDGQMEWLICEYENLMQPAEIVVHETYNPGAVYKITVFDKAGEETLAWEGEDPTPRDQPRGVSVFPVKLDFAFKKIKVYIDSPAVPGWNEIDAVGLRDADGNTQWAKHVEASTTYGVTPDTSNVPLNITAAQVVEYLQQFAQLKQEVAELKEEVKELNALRNEIKELKELLKQNNDR